MYGWRERKRQREGKEIEKRGRNGRHVFLLMTRCVVENKCRKCCVTREERDRKQGITLQCLSAFPHPMTVTMETGIEAQVLLLSFSLKRNLDN